MNFGVRLQRVLDEIGMSQSELGRRIGATSQSVNGWCQAGILPRKEMLEQLPDITGKPLYWFFMTDEDEETLQPPSSEDIYVLTPETKKLIEIYDQLPQVEQERFVGLMQLRLEELDAFMKEYLKKRKKD
ncbi:MULTISPECIES: helix-turn-helix domain-containing protein [Klebsiella pneumoniae complex]|uniref:helix-turn-helix domain-containing protein n=1 Tax=Klebsiella pneumoniae complex TaxID=3390273 RepID=UPI0007DA6AD0|nr:transcriptional regulator [Klebsiella pneumoniae]HBQ5819002.1 transcriptional regulator [Klebsiella pneumoniae subsp. pneumoniae]HBQ6654738.1 transcriptional regulator [Klebsiella quasipneumoniae subsp. quasipneumoniae]HBR0964221.1 transcriptional regulator [Klebsiella quasipneumoniae subsp. similipneumoniae]HCD9053883.1 transcriptional regulator [Klebsiella quasipneumoniae]